MRTRRSAAAMLAAMLAVIGAGAATLSTSDASACGQCHGDKIAVVYDHATVLRAIRDGKAVAFADVEGGFMKAGEKAVAHMRTTVASVRGVQKDTVKVSDDPTAVAFVFDPKEGNVGQFLERMNKKLKPKGWTLVHLRTIDKEHP